MRYGQWLSSHLNEIQIHVFTYYLDIFVHILRTNSPAFSVLFQVYREVSEPLKFSALMQYRYSYLYSNTVSKFTFGVSLRSKQHSWRILMCLQIEREQIPGFVRMLELLKNT